MRLLSPVLCTLVAAGLLIGCSGNTSATMPTTQTAGGQVRTSGYEVTPPTKKAALRGIYISEYGQPSSGASIIYGYQGKNRKNKPPTCNVSGGYVRDIATDKAGNLIVPNGSGSVVVYAGPGMCGSEVGSIGDPYQPEDAASMNAANGKIVVANNFGGNGYGSSLSVCSLKDGCTSLLTNGSMFEMGGVALAKNGDCWADTAGATYGTAVLVYFPNCSGFGQVATGFVNTSLGGHDIDNKGNIVSIDYLASAFYVYSGCNPACKLVSGPWDLHGQSIWGHLNKQSDSFAAGDLGGSADIYAYKPTHIAYSYSITNGLTQSDNVYGVAFNPRSKQ